jgi:hypothetical protein
MAELSKCHREALPVKLGNVHQTLSSLLLAKDVNTGARLELKFCPLHVHYMTVLCACVCMHIIMCMHASGTAFTLCCHHL